MKRFMSRHNAFSGVWIWLLLAELFHPVRAEASAATNRQQAVPLPYVARWNCKGYGQLILRTSDQLPDGRRVGTIESTKLKKVFPGYWQGGSSQWFTPSELTPQSPWLYFSRTGAPNTKLYLGLKKWPEGSDVSGIKPIACTVRH